MSIEDGVTLSPTLASSDATVEIRPNLRRIPRVPQQLRLNKPSQRYIYDPMTVSIGPYHHGEEHLRQLEKFKHEALQHILSGSGTDKSLYYNKIFERIDEIRNCYVEVTKDEYDDATLSEMILLDTFFCIYIERGFSPDGIETIEHCSQHLGLWVVPLLAIDLNMLENQIPYWVLKLLIKLRFGEDGGKSFLYKHVREYFLVESATKIPWLEEKEDGDKVEEPLHNLEASQRIFCLQPADRIENNVGRSAWIFKWIMKMKMRMKTRTRMWMKKIKKDEDDNTENKIDNFGRQFYSVTDLKSKGIHLSPSSRCWSDVKFKSNAFHGEIQIPIYIITPRTHVFLQNVVAFELSPKPFYNEFSGISYINLMKALIVNSNDVKELRERGILFHRLGSDKEVVKVFQEIDTLGVDDDLFKDVKTRIREHCNNKGKTWIAEFINTKLKSPWTAIAFLAATFLLVLTVVQTYYTIRAA